MNNIHHQILGVSKDATPKEIKTAFRKLSLKLHPDQNGGDIFFKTIFIQLKNSFDYLMNNTSHNPNIYNSTTTSTSVDHLHELLIKVRKLSTDLGGGSIFVEDEKVIISSLCTLINDEALNILLNQHGSMIRKIVEEIFELYQNLNWSFPALQIENILRKIITQNPNLLKITLNKLEEIHDRKYCDFYQYLNGVDTHSSRPKC